MLLELCLSPGVGGLELYALKVIDHYSMPNQVQGNSFIAVVGRGTFLDKRLQQRQIQRRHLQVHNRYFPLLTAWQLAKLIDVHEVDTVHIHWRGDLPLAAFAVKLCRQSVRLVYTRQMALTRPKFDIYHRFLYRQVDVCLTITRQLRNDAKRFLPLPEEKIHLLYYGVPEPAQPTSNQCKTFFQEAGLQSAMFTVGLFGRIEYGKGQHLLLEAIRLLLLRGHNVQALLIGHIMDQAYFDGLMKKAKSAGLENRVVYFGFHDNPSAVMACFDVVVLATKEETFGLVLAEAMRAGAAVIGSDAGGVPEIIQSNETGLLFEPENAHNLADCLEKLLMDLDLKKTLSRQGKAFADKTFSEEVHFAQLNKFLSVSSKPNIEP